MIPHRPKVGRVTAILLALAFALAITPVLRIDLWLVASGSLEVRADQPSPVTVRVPPFAGWDGPERIGGGGILIARGEIADQETASLVRDLRSRTPHGVFGDLAYFAVVLAMAAIYTELLRRSTRGRLLRTQLVLLGMLLFTAVAVKAAMMLTSMSVLAVPVALLALATAIAVDRDAGVATGVLASMLVGLLVPFDVGVTAILLIQALTAVLLLPDQIRLRWRTAITAGLAAAVIGAVAYGIVHYLTRGTAPVDELGRLTYSSWIAASVGGLIAAFASAVVAPALQVAVGDITDAKLVELDNFSHPLLKQIAEKSPGTWQHSLAMANMAEIAANVIGANARLVRVGALYHDLGKSLQPKYFIENVESGEQSPHDRLPPEVSCDAIFAHVTEGIATARRANLPERVIDFMHMHHGDGVLEYFWAKCQEQGNPRSLTSEDFRYPGVPPQSRETAILAICDAVEAASRTLKRPDQQAIGALVQRIVYGKLHLGQLDDSGLSMSDLRKISDSLRETIKHAHHGRIEYPWQRAEREASEREHATVHERPGGVAVPAASRDSGPSITQRLMNEPRLDSLDAPRPPWAAGGEGSDTGRRRKAPISGEEATVQVPTDPDAHHSHPAMIRAAESLPPGLAIEDTVSLRPLTETQQVAHAPTAEQPAVSPAELAAAAIDDPGPEIIPLPEKRWSGTFAAAAEKALSVVEPLPQRPATDEPTRERAPSEWGQRLAARLDAMADPDEEEPEETDIVGEQPAPAQTTRRLPPPPPRARKPATTLEVEGDDVEASIEMSPSVRSAGTGPIVGPPPATRPAPPPAITRPDTEEPSDDDVTVVPAHPPSTMLPPRARPTKLGRGD